MTGNNRIGDGTSCSLMELEMWCPSCDQGNVVEALIKHTGEVIFVCEECEAMWHRRVDISEKGFEDLGNYLISLGLQPLRDELSVK